MYFGLATLEWTTRVTGLALRADGVYAKRERFDRFEPSYGGCELSPGATDASYLSSKITAAGALIGVTFDLGRGPFRPYVFGSAGAVRTHDRFTSGVTSYPTCEPTCLLPLNAAGERHERPLSAAGQVGLGLAYSFPWFSVVGETRYTAVGFSTTRGLDGAVPVSLGMRF